MSRSDDKFIIRLPPGMRWKLKELAVKNRRSMNAEMLLAIESWLGETETAGKVVTPPPSNETAALQGG